MNNMYTIIRSDAEIFSKSFSYWLNWLKRKPIWGIGLIFCIEACATSQGMDAVSRNKTYFASMRAMLPNKHASSKTLDRSAQDRLYDAMVDGDEGMVYNMVYNLLEKCAVGDDFLNSYLNKKDAEGNTLLHLAIKKGYQDIVFLLLQKIPVDADCLYEKDAKLKTILHLAIEQGYERMAIDIALKMSMEGLLMEDVKQKTAFHTAVHNSRKETFSALFDRLVEWCNYDPDEIFTKLFQQKNVQGAGLSVFARAYLPKSSKSLTITGWFKSPYSKGSVPKSRKPLTATSWFNACLKKFESALGTINWLPSPCHEHYEPIPKKSLAIISRFESPCNNEMFIYLLEKVHKFLQPSHFSCILAEMDSIQDSGIKRRHARYAELYNIVQSYMVPDDISSINELRTQFKEYNNKKSASLATAIVPAVAVADVPTVVSPIAPVPVRRPIVAPPPPPKSVVSVVPVPVRRPIVAPPPPPKSAVSIAPVSFRRPIVAPPPPPKPIISIVSVPVKRSKVAPPVPPKPIISIASLPVKGSKVAPLLFPIEWVAAQSAHTPLSYVHIKGANNSVIGSQLDSQIDDESEDAWSDEENTWSDEENTWSDEEDTWSDEEDAWSGKEEKWPDKEAATRVFIYSK